MTYKIIIQTLQGIVLTFSVNEFDIKKGLVIFWDSKDQVTKRFPVANCEIHGDGPEGEFQ